MSLRAYDRVRLALTAIGLVVAGYLTLLHYDTRVPLVCSAGAIVDCRTVLGSPSAVVLGVPVAVFGLLWFTVALVLAARAVRAGDLVPPLARRADLTWLLIGVASVLWLVYQEVGVIGKICAWCTVIHLIILALLGVHVVSEPTRAGGTRR
jgi:uncharacterized membrane protein